MPLAAVAATLPADTSRARARPAAAPGGREHPEPLPACWDTACGLGKPALAAVGCRSAGAFLEVLPFRGLRTRDQIRPNPPQIHPANGPPGGCRLLSCSHATPCGTRRTRKAVTAVPERQEEEPAGPLSLRGLTSLQRGRGRRVGLACVAAWPHALLFVL